MQGGFCLVLQPALYRSSVASATQTIVALGNKLQQLPIFVILGDDVLKKTLLAGATALVLIGATSQGNAADIAVKAPRPVPVAENVYDWSGFYVGGSLGWDWIHSDSTSTKLDPAGFGTPRVQSASNSWGGIIGGGQLGYNWVLSRQFLLGIEGDISGANAVLNQTIVSADGTAYSSAKIDTFASVRARAGFLAGGNALLYGTGGVAWSQGVFKVTQGPCAINPACIGSAVPLGAISSNDISRIGWTAGAGIEWGFAPHWSLKAEYLYADFGTFTIDRPTFNRTSTLNLTEQIVRVGVNYHFNWGAPVVARY